MDKVQFTIISPEQVVFKDAIDMVVIPGENGDFGVLPHHAALISNLRPGLITIYQDHKITQQIFTTGGFVQVQPQDCTVLSEETVMLKDLKGFDLETQLNDLRVDLELVHSEDEKKNLERTLTLTQLKLDLIQRLSHL